MPIIPAANLPLTARIINLIGHAVKQFCSRGQQMLSPLASLLETRVINFLLPIDGLMVTRIGQTTTQEQAQLF